MKEVDSIIFDLDGTLVDSKEGIVNSVNFTLRELGLGSRPFDEIVSFIGTGVNSLIDRSVGGDRRLFDKGVLIFENHYKKHYAGDCGLYPYAADVLDFFKDKALFVVTNRKKDLARFTLDSLGIGRYFKDVIGGDDESCLKPSPCPLNKAVGIAGDRKRIIIVGDMDLDVLSGRQAGILTCAVTYGIGKRDDIVKTNPDYIIDDLSKLKEIIT